MASLGNSVATENQKDLATPAIDATAELTADVFTAEVAVEDGAAALIHNPKIEEIRERLARESHNSISSRHDTRSHPRVRAPRVSVVVPARNEALNIPIVFAEIPEDVYEIVVVDGDSKDGTAEVALAQRDNVRVVGQDRPGKGNALICGFNACKGDIVVMIDADGSMDPKEIPLYVDALTNGADFVKGSRFMEGGGSTDITPIRSAGNHGLRLMVNGLFGPRYSDLCYGYAAFWRWTLPHLALDCDGFEIETMMNIRAHTAGLTIAEVPSMEYDRIHGESNLNAVRDGLRILRVIVSERLTPKRRRRERQKAAELPAT